MTLLSIGQILDRFPDWEVIFRREVTTIRHQDSQREYTIAHRDQRTRLYKSTLGEIVEMLQNVQKWSWMNERENLAQANLQAFLAPVKADNPAQNIHDSLLHSEDIWKRVDGRPLMEGLDHVRRFKRHENCDGCIRGKATTRRAPIKAKGSGVPVAKPTRLFQHVSVDMLGKFAILGTNKEKFILLIV